MSRQVFRTRDIIKKIIKYEFEIGYLGVSQSIFTEDIIESEVKRISKHRKDLDISKVYLVKKSSSKVRITEVINIDDAIRKAKEAFGKTYIIADGEVYTPSINGVYTSDIEKLNQ